MPSFLRRRFEPPTQPWFWVVAGTVGILLVVCGVIVDGHGLLERMGSLWRPLITIPGHLLVLLAWWQLGPLWRRPVVTATIWSSIMALAPPLHSRDAYSYAAQGWLMNHGLDPYVVASGEAGQAGLLAGVHWFRTTSVYPPLSLEIFQGVSWLFQGDLYWTPIGMRLPNVLAIIVLVWALRRLAAHVGVAASVVLWAGVLNPVVLVQWVGGIHNDAIMVAALALAFLASFNLRWRGWAGLLAGGAGIGLAMSIKQSAAVAGLGVVALAWAAWYPHMEQRRRTWWTLAVRAAGAGAAAVGVFALLSILTGLGMGWSNPTAGNPLMATSNAPISWVASFIRFRELLPDDVTLSILSNFSYVLVVIGLVWLIVKCGPRPGQRVGDPWLVVVGSLTVFAVLGPALQPWYFTWIFPFVALSLPTYRVSHGFVVTTFVMGMLASMQDSIPPYVAMVILIYPAYWLWKWLDRHELRVFRGVV